MPQSASIATRPAIPSPEVIRLLAKPKKSKLRADCAIKLLVPLLLAAALVMACRWGSCRAYGQLLSRHAYSAWLPGLAAGYTLLMLGFQLLRTILWAGYRPYPLAEGPLPSLTVIIPAYNEGAMVEKAIYSVAASDYPGRRGWKSSASTTAPGTIPGSIFNGPRGVIPTWSRPCASPPTGARRRPFMPASPGAGARSSSPSIPTASSHRTPCAIWWPPAATDGRIGAVAGNVKVFNRHQSLMGKMQGVRFVNLDYLRASQSRYRAVICTPGSLSAYRRDALRPHLKAWLRQTFLGAPCPHSEDRALTNFILRGGYYTYYQRTAVVYTLVPETYKGVCNMYLRWERGNVRESAVQLGYLFTRYRPKYRLLPIVEFFLAQLEYPLTLLFLALLLGSVAVYPPLLLKLLALLGIGSLLNLIYYLWLERDLEFVYGIIYSYYAFFLLPWIYPYAFVTVRDRHWLTR